MKLPAVAKNVLDKIGSGEGGTSYNKLFGGREFHSFRDHPRIPVPIPGTDKASTAAGRYQMLAGTWDRQKTKLGLKDFSPASQDAAAWDLAHETYKQVTGRDLADDATRGQVNWGALSNQWTSLRSELAAKAQQQGPGATSPAFPLSQVPTNTLSLEPAGDPSLALRALQSVTKHQLTPVDHNPFQAAPFLTPVDHDPFAKEESSSP